MSILSAVGAILASRSSSPKALKKVAEEALGHPMTTAEAKSIDAALAALHKSNEQSIKSGMKRLMGKRILSPPPTGKRILPMAKKKQKRILPMAKKMRKRVLPTGKKKKGH